jgi:protein SCO1/2
MTNRRTILAHLAAGAAALPSLALGAQDSRAQHAHNASDCECARPRTGPYSEYFPNVVVVTHEGRRALFYNDLLRGKTVLVNCMSVANEAVYPVTANLARVERLLGERAGREVFIYSVTVDPEHDTPRALAEFAERHGVGPGWLFLTGLPDTIGLLRARLFADAAAHGHAHGQAREHAHGAARDCSLGLVRYGNEAIGLWGSVPSKADPEWIVRRLSWVSPREHTSGAPKRRGPTPLLAQDSRARNSGGGS